MSTKSVHGRWEAKFTKLQGWVEAHGRLPMRGSGSAEEDPLGAWIAGQRKRHELGFMPDRHREALLGIPGVLDARPPTARQIELKAWAAAHQRRPLPGSSDPAEASLAQLVFGLRRRAFQGKIGLEALEVLLCVPDGLADAEKAIVLSALGVKLERRRSRVAGSRANLDPLEAKWSRGFNELTKWVAEHGELPRRRSTETIQYRVANWLNVQRMQHRKGNLLPDYVDRLQSIPGALQPRRPWTDIDLATSIAAFHAEHGRLPGWHNVPTSERTLATYSWRLRRKTQEGTIAAEALEVLSTVPGATAPLPERKTPEQRLAELDDYIKATGRLPTTGRGGLSEWYYRALNGKGSRDPKAAAEFQLSVTARRDSVGLRQAA